MYIHKVNRVFRIDIVGVKDPENWVTYVEETMPYDHPGYYTVDSNTFTVDSENLVTKYTKLPHSWNKPRPSKTIVDGTLVTTKNFTRADWISNGYKVQFTIDPTSELSNYIKRGTPYTVDHEFYRVITNYHPVSVEEATSSFKDRLKREYELAIDEPLPYMGYTFRMDDSERALITSILSGGSLPTGFYFRSIENVNVPMTFTELQGLSVAAVERGMVLFDNMLNGG